MTDSNEKFKVKLNQPSLKSGQNLPDEYPEKNPDLPPHNRELEMTEMDMLYQEALNAMEEVESELNRTSEILLEDVDLENSIEETPSTDEPENEQENNRTDSIVLKLNNQSKNDVTPEMIIESLLFVGGRPLTTKKLCQIIGGNADPDSMEKLIEGLNHTYESQNRPYEIQFGEGGYHLTLKSEFDRVRNKVFGMGPKEIKLSQEALEILAIVAYQQPVSRENVDKLSKRSTNTLLRQLLRRELIEIERNDDNRQTVTYKTTERFLQLFGLRDLSELPQSEMIEYK